MGARRRLDHEATKTAKNTKHEVREESASLQLTGQGAKVTKAAKHEVREAALLAGFPLRISCFASFPAFVFFVFQASAFAQPLNRRRIRRLAT